jgi:hypothetical protein
VEHIIRGEDGAKRDEAERLANADPDGLAHEIAKMLRYVC